ncbi:c-type cytochrome [Pararhizobium antarcticum]|uniref:Cytochrome C n=1 Tax=Pararhizobium antarcticum TaxID=1798805 RepID=A0A657LXX0_9HYPH|nr:cytochrome c [Pararhizobium antarcticum]OJG00277.1 cytochrome C [Pararhizobium antarcticum]OJG00906.1 cytochrome C [Rhizobium sp. 58]
MGVKASVAKLAVLTLPIAVSAMVISVATAQTAPPSNVIQRQDGMKAMANSAKTINAMFKDTSPYDANAFKAAAETVRAHSGAALSALFEGLVTTQGSKASANIETERQQFDKLANDLGIYASALSAVADRNPHALGPETRMQGGEAMGGGPLARKVDAARDVASMPAEHAFHMMLQTCTSCHVKFRIEAK